MFKKSATALVAILVLVGSARADEQLVQDLKQMGQAVDNMSTFVSQAASDADAAQIAQAVQQTFAANLSGNPKPQVTITASAGKCYVLITAPALAPLESAPKTGRSSTTERQSTDALLLFHVAFRQHLSNLSDSPDGLVFAVRDF